MTLKKIPSLAICIPCYNGGRFLSTAIESILAQKEQASEVLVSNNWSTDETESILQKYKRNIRITRPTKHLSYSDHLYFLAKRVNADYVVFPAADDALHPNFVRYVQSKLQGMGFVTTGRFDCDHNMRPFCRQGLSFKNKVLLPNESFPMMINGCGYSISGTAFNRKALLSAPHLPADAALAGDWYFALAINSRWPVLFIRKPLHYYRYHDKNTSHSQPTRWHASATEMMRFILKEGYFDHWNKIIQKKAKSYAIELLTIQGSLSITAPYNTVISNYCNDMLYNETILKFQDTKHKPIISKTIPISKLKMLIKRLLTISYIYKHPDFLR